MTTENDALATALEALDALKVELDRVNDDLIRCREDDLFHAHKQVVALKAELAALRASRGPQEAAAQADKVETPLTLEQHLEHAINSTSAEQASNTPDFILAQFLMGCLAAWNQGIQQRHKWYRDVPELQAPAPPVAASGAEGDGR